MDPLPLARWHRIDDLLAEALDRDPDQRTAFLRQACDGDLPLYHEITTLLDDAAPAAGFLGDSAADFAAPLLNQEEFTQEDLAEEELAGGLAPGDHVGPYQVEAEVGRGGMGTVYRATRADGAFDKTVALKLVKRGMDTDEVLARFRRERQVLAGLDHPGIARLLDGGAADDGRPYLVMEFVAGEPITAYCDGHGLSLERRLSLFEQVGAAVQHAHRRLVVHRDLKPSNVLVAEGEHSEPQVKLLDFGIAKLLEAELDEGLTQTGARRLTPAYAAPEQLRGEAVTTSADVYALGVLLYELLAGHRPETPAKPPSTTLKVEAAEGRGTAVEGLRRRLRGDLDVICLTALREDVSERYGSVEALLDDLRRWRSGRPIEARPASVGYRVRKFVGRHRIGVLATVLVAAALCTGLGTALWQAQAKTREAARADRARDFALNLFSLADPNEAQGQEVTTNELLDQGAERALNELADDPEVQEQALQALADINHKLSRYEAARHLYERVLTLRQTRLGPDHPTTATSLGDLASIADAEGKLDESQALYERALDIQRRRLDPDDPALAQTLYNFGVLARSQNDLDAAEQRHQEALRIRQLHYGADSPEVAESLKSLALVQHQRGALDQAEPLYREALTLQIRRSGEMDPEVGVMLNSLASLLRARGDYVEADTLYRRAITVYRHLFPDGHRQFIVALSNRGALLVERGEPTQAEELLAEALAMARRLLDAEHPSVALSLSVLGLALSEQQRYEEAADAVEQSLAIYRNRLGPEHLFTGVMLRSMGDIRLGQGNLEAAETLYRQALTIQDAELPESHADRTGVLLGLGRVALARRNSAEAEPLLRRTLAICEEQRGDAHPQTAEARSWLGAALTAQRRYAEAEPLLAASARVLDVEARRSIHRAVRANLAAYRTATGRRAVAAR